MKQALTMCLRYMYLFCHFHHVLMYTYSTNDTLVNLYEKMWTDIDVLYKILFIRLLPRLVLGIIYEKSPNHLGPIAPLNKIKQILRVWN